jgi:hypothetical protein
MEIVLTIVSYLVAAAVGAFVWSKVSPYVSNSLAARAAKNAVSNAQKLIAAEEAHAAAVRAAHVTVAAHVATSAVTGTTGPTVLTGPTGSAA